MPRFAAVIALAALLALAGCSAFGGVDGTTRQPFDVEPTETTAADGTTNETPAVISFNPVQDTVPSPFLVVEAHETELNGRSYVLDIQTRQTYANGTTRLRENVTTTYGPNRSRYVQDWRASFKNDSMHRELYANGTHVWERLDYDDSEAESPKLLRRASGEPVPPSAVAVDRSTNTVLSGLLTMSVTDVEKLDTVPSGVEEPVFRVVANESRRPDPYGDETLSASLTLIVTEDGRIIEYTHEYTYVEDGQRIHAEKTIQYLAVDVATVERPEWVPTGNATNATVATGTRLGEPVRGTATVRARSAV